MKIEIIEGCRLKGKALKKGKIVEVDRNDAKTLVNMGRAKACSAEEPKDKKKE